jgi:RNA polymerase sigma factor (sigma-70 family)
LTCLFVLEEKEVLAMAATAEQQATNAALASLAAAGNTFALGQLWETNRGLIRSMFWKWYPHHKNLADQHGVTADDFEQEGFFAVRYAAQTYDPAAGAFSTWLAQAMQRQIQLTLSNGHRRKFVDEDGKTHTTSADPLNHCFSLDLPIDSENADGPTLGEVQPDPAAEQAFTAADERISSAQTRAVLDDALDRCGATESAVMRHRFFDGLSMAATGEKMGITPAQVRTIETRALRKLRSDPKLRRWHDRELENRAWHGTGYLTWRETGSSVAERVTERLEKMEREKITRNSPQTATDAASREGV